MEIKLSDLKSCQYVSLLSLVFFNLTIFDMLKFFLNPASKDAWNMLI